MKKIVLASNNQGKLREFSNMFASLDFEMLSAASLNVPECPEPHVTFVENALAKARHASLHTGLPALADDSGLCVQALAGAPGVYSARFAANAGVVLPHESNDQANNRYLLERLEGVLTRDAYFYCVLVFVRHANDPQPIIADGVWHGEILLAPSGENGFGYDPLFYVKDQQCSAAELLPEIKHQISHRGKALNILLDRLSQVLL